MDLDEDFYEEGPDEEEEEEDEGEEMPYHEDVYQTLGQHPERYQEEYQKYWRQIYGVEPTLPERARAFREAELRRRGGPEAIRQERLSQFTQQMAGRQVPPQVRAQRTIARAYTRYRCPNPCENLVGPERKLLNPSQRIRLRVKDRQGQIHCVCYDIIKLYAYLIFTFGPDTLLWRDPTYNTYISSRQTSRIEKMWRQFNPCGASMFSKMVVQAASGNQVSLPVELYEQLSLRENVPYLIFRISNPQGDYRYVTATTFHQPSRAPPSQAAPPSRAGRTAQPAQSAPAAQPSQPAPPSQPAQPTIQLPRNILQSLNLTPGNPVLVETCFNLAKVERIRLQPLSPEWNRIPDRDLDLIKAELTRTLENYYVVQIGQTISIMHPLGQLQLLIVDLFARGRRILAGLTKFTQVEVDFTPYSSEGRIYW